MKIFLRHYASQVGDVGLKFLSFGGLYIAGGIAPKNAEQIDTDEFRGFIFNKGRMGSVLQDMPIYLVMDADVGLRGSKVIAKRLLKQSFEVKENDEDVDEKDVQVLIPEVEERPRLPPRSFSPTKRIQRVSNPGDTPPVASGYSMRAIASTFIVGTIAGAAAAAFGLKFFKNLQSD